MRKLTWLWCGLLGGTGLSIVTLRKLIQAIVAGRAGGADLSEAGGFFALMFTIGFVCGLVAWAGLELSRRFGTVGDALTGVAVMVVFFLGCALAFTPQMLGPRFIDSGGIGLFGLAIVAGLYLGISVGRDLRREIAASASPEEGHEDRPTWRRPSPEPPDWK